MDFLDGKILVSISTDKVENKDSNIWASLKYKKTEIRLSQLTELIKQKYAFCGVFDDEEITQLHKTKSNWVGAYIVPIDLDNRKMPFEEFIELIEESEICPNLAYRTANDGTKGNRYRLLYCFDEMIVNETLYKQIYDGLIQQIETLTNEKNHDNCGGVITQSFAGTDKAKDILYNDFYFSIKGVKELFGISTLNLSDKHKREKEQKPIAKKRQIKYDNFDFSNYDLMIKEFAQDFNKMGILQLIEKYGTLYPNIESTPLKEENEDIAFIDIPQNYIEIKRYWFLTDEALKNNKMATIRKISDGMGRRKKLYLNAIIRRLINNIISFDNLLFNIICEFSYYMINDGNKITKKDLFEIVERAYNADLSKYNNLIIGNNERKFIVNPLFCIKHNISKKAAVRIAVKQRNAQKIGELYDFNLTDKENIEVMKKYGVDICLRTLKQWKKENGLTMKRNKSAKTNYKEEERTLYTCNCTFSNENKNVEVNGQFVVKNVPLNNNKKEEKEMNTNKHNVRTRNNYVEQLPIDEETNEQGVNKWGFWLITYNPDFTKLHNLIYIADDGINRKDWQVDCKICN
ncbi:MAG: hypothetical protein IJK62_08285 [Bacteroidales bacterium]|nr:hypothetical protein [Prevotella sp.]MBQ6276688.1 hypothetical protein [Bacteroidales bacterium]